MALLGGTDAKMQFNSRLQKSRHGIYYLRVQRSGLDRKWSLKTRDQSQAKLAAFALSYKIALMTKQDQNNSFNDYPELTLDENLMKRAGEIIAQQRAQETFRKLEAKKLEAEYLALMLKDHPELKALHEAAAVTATTPIEPATPTSQIQTKEMPNTVSIGWALAEYQLDLMKDLTPKSKPSLKTRKQALSTVRKLCALLGDDFDMSKLSDDVVEDRWLPNRLSDAEPTTAKRDLSHVRGFVEWAADRKRRFVPAKLTFSIKAEGENYDYLDKFDLKAIFANLPENAKKPWQLWVPILGLYTGARISEIASLKVEYFSIKSGLNVMFLAGTKTQSSPRDLPLHKDLVKIGLLDYVEKRRQAGKEMLFDLACGSNGWGDEPSGWFTDYKKIINMTEPLKVFHSFRHTIIDHMNQNGVENVKAGSQYTGHSDGGGVRNQVYGRKPLGLKVMQEQVVSKINWLNYCGWEPDFAALKAKANSFL